MRSTCSRALPGQRWNSVLCFSPCHDGDGGGAGVLRASLASSQDRPPPASYQVSWQAARHCQSCCPGCPRASLVGVEWQAVSPGRAPFPRQDDSVLAQGSGLRDRGLTQVWRTQRL